jgi:hypothetical protein
MLQFFADSTNFTRRLTDVRANAKFSSPYATPEDVSSVSTPPPAPLMLPLPLLPQLQLCSDGPAAQSKGCVCWACRAQRFALQPVCCLQQHPAPSCPAPAQGRREDLKSVVENLRKRYGVQYVYCWHGELPGGRRRVAASQLLLRRAAQEPAGRALCAHPPPPTCPPPQACLPTGAACRPPPPPWPNTSPPCTSPSPPRALARSSPGGAPTAVMSPTPTLDQSSASR